MWSLMVRSPDAEMQEVLLKEGKNILGRSPDVDIVIHDDSASRYHAQIEFTLNNNHLILQDLNSTNGTYVNGKQINESQMLTHQDQIRVGRHLLTVISSESRQKVNDNKDKTKSIVTGDLMMKSIDNYAVLLHDIGYQLINIPELDKAFAKITETIRLMIGADDCLIVLQDQADDLVKYGVSPETIQEVIKQNSATIFTSERIRSDSSDLTRKRNRSMMLVPVTIEDVVCALIFVTKTQNPFGFSQDSDLQLVIAVSHQVALSIQRNRVEEELLHNAYHDSLTGLANRAMLLDRLRHSFQRGKRNPGYLFAILFLDIDNFKIVNDSLGHATGDKLLIAFSERLVDNLRKMDAVSRYDRIARFGGDEFAILLDDIANEQDALRVATRLNEILAEPFYIEGKEIFITSSIGITINTMGYDTPDDMLRDADIAMYRAKELGKSRVEIYDAVMHNLLMSRLSLETELRKAMQNQEFRLHYQPIINLQTLKIVGMEALLRWHSPRGIIEPPEFFAALDTSGLINYIDLWALDYACKDVAKIQEAFPMDPPLYVSVNISANFVRSHETIEILDDVLKKSKITTDALHLEITERVGLKNEEATLELLKVIQERGIHLCLDDFGTGYSTLSYLLQFPIAGLKIDRSFVEMMTSEPKGYRIIESLKSLATPLGMSLIAEGIETEKQLNMLKEMGIEYGQGYLFAKALEIDRALQFIQDNLNQKPSALPGKAASI